MSKEYDKNKNPLYTNKSFLMTVNWKDLPKHSKWIKFVKECYKENGYGWWYRKDTNFRKTNFKRKGGF